MTPWALLILVLAVLALGYDLALFESWSPLLTTDWWLGGVTFLAGWYVCAVVWRLLMR